MGQFVNYPERSLRSRLNVHLEVRGGPWSNTSATGQIRKIDCSPHLKIEFSYLISGSILFPFASTDLEMFIVARNDAIKIQADDWTRCLPGQILRERATLPRGSSRKASGTYSATKPKGVTPGITAFCRLLVYRFQVPLRLEAMRVFEQCFVS